MKNECWELLIRIMAIPAVPGDTGFLFKRILDEIRRGFGADDARLFVNINHMNVGKWTEWTGSGRLELHEVNSRPMEDHEALKPLHLEAGHTRLTFPLHYEGHTFMAFWLFWRRGRPPAWINRGGLMSDLSTKTGKCVFEKLLLIKTAAENTDLQFIIDHVPLAIAIINHEYIIERANRTFHTLFKTHPDSAIGQPCYELVHGTRIPNAMCSIQESIKQRCDMKIECMSNTGGMLDIRIIPFSTTTNQVKVIEIFNPKHTGSYKSRPEVPNTMYNLINAPLTSIALLLEIILLDPNQHLHVRNIRKLQEDTLRLISLCKDELVDLQV